MNILTQIVAVAAMSLRSLPHRFGTSMVIVVGIGGVVAVLLSMLAMAVGYSQTVQGTGRMDRVIVLRSGSGAELSSSITREQVSIIKDAPGVRQDLNGRPTASAEAVVMVNLPKKGETTDANVAVRGVGQENAELRPELKIIAGRNFQPALRELIVGKGAQEQFQGLELGATIDIRETEWTIVGVFESNGDSHESSLMADADTVMAAYRRPTYQSISMMLETPDAFTTLKDALTTNPALTVDVKREPEYYAEQSERLGKILFVVAYVVGSIMAVGALFSALNTMYAAVSTRTMEIATLRAIGFGAVPVVVSILAEAMVLALAGGLIGAALAWIAFNGNAVSTLGGNFTQVVFPLMVTPGLVVLGLTWACVVGLLGGLFPALRVAMVPVAVALQAR